MSGMPPVFKQPGQAGSNLGMAQAQSQFDETLRKQGMPAMFSQQQGPAFNPSVIGQGQGAIAGRPKLPQPSDFLAANNASISGSKGAQQRSGLLGTALGITPPAQQAPKPMGFTDKLVSGLANLPQNQLFMLGTALSNPKQNFAENLQDYTKSAMQQQLFKQQLADSEFDKLYKQGMLDVNKLTAEAAYKKAGLGEYKAISMADEKGNKFTAMFDKRGQFLYADGTPIPQEILEKSSIIQKPPVSLTTVKSPAVIQAEQDAAIALKDKENKLALQQMGREKNYEYLMENYVNPGASAVKFSKGVDNLMETFQALKMDEKGGVFTGTKAQMKKLFGINDTDVTALEAAEAFRNQYAPQLRVPGSGATTDFEMQKFLAAFPSLSMTADGRRMLKKAANVFADREKYVAKKLQDDMNQGKLLTDADGQRYYDEAREMFILDPYFMSVNSGSGVRGNYPGINS